jgi:hypothetical protein
MSAEVAALVEKVAEANGQIQAWTDRRDELAAELKASAGWTDEELAVFLADEPAREQA